MLLFMLRCDRNHVSLVERTPGCVWQEMAIVTRSMVFCLVKDREGENWQPAGILKGVFTPVVFRENRVVFIQVVPLVGLVKVSVCLVTSFQKKYAYVIYKVTCMDVLDLNVCVGEVTSMCL